MNKKAGVELAVLFVILVVAVIALVYVFKSPTGAAVAGVECVCSAACESNEAPYEASVNAIGSDSDTAVKDCWNKLITTCRTTDLNRQFIECRYI